MSYTAQILEQACAEWKLNPQNYTLVLSNNKELDLSLSIRLAGIASGQKLQLKRKSNSTKQQGISPSIHALNNFNEEGGSVVTVAVQNVATGERTQSQFNPSASLLDIVSPIPSSESKIPVVNFLNREV